MKKLIIKRVHHVFGEPVPITGGHTIQPIFVEPENSFYWKLNISLDEWIDDYIRSICNKKGISSSCFWISRDHLISACHKYCEGRYTDLYHLVVERLINRYGYIDNGLYLKPSKSTMVVYPK